MQVYLNGTRLKLDSFQDVRTWLRILHPTTIRPTRDHALATLPSTPPPQQPQTPTPIQKKKTTHSNPTTHHHPNKPQAYQPPPPKQYLKLYEGLEPPVAFEKVNDRWEVGVGISDGQFQQVSFVNGICTVRPVGSVVSWADLCVCVCVVFVGGCR